MSTALFGHNAKGHKANGWYPIAVWPVVSADMPDPLGGQTEDVILAAHLQVQNLIFRPPLQGLLLPKRRH